MHSFVCARSWLSPAGLSRPAPPAPPAPSLPRLPLLSWPSPTFLSAFYPSFLLTLLLPSSLFFLPSLVFSTFPSNTLWLSPCLSPSLPRPRPVCISPIPLPCSSSLCLLTVCLCSGCTSGAWCVQGGPVGDPRLLCSQRQTQPSPNKQTLLWAAACAFRIPLSPDMSLIQKGQAKEGR